MTCRSLRVRLGVAAAISISLALLVAAGGLIMLFELHVERRIGAELKAQLDQLAASVQIGAEGQLEVVPTPVDPRLEHPLGGLYWQIDDETEPKQQLGIARSRSLWDSLLRLPSDELEPGTVHAHRLAGPNSGPNGQSVLVRERLILLEHDSGQRRLRLITAIDANELTQARNAFAADILPYLALLAVLLGLATLAQIRAGLAPLEALRRGVGAVRSGREQQLAANYPDEVMPLVNEVNALLAAREQAVERARAWTADLAHGLKTPLTALSADAERLRTEGNRALAHDLDQLAEAMRRRVDRELIRARLRSGAATHQAQAEVGDAIERLLRTLRRTPFGECIDWSVDVPQPALAALMPGDLLELLGNLLENAAHWAKQCVEIQVQSGDPIQIRISDDGPGVPAAEWPRLGERGLRLDQGTQGSGLGLAIVRDVIDAYGGGVTFGRAAIGGLEVRLRLPGTFSRAASEPAGARR
ncbi:histidine kinase [Lamprobacter modestohalophilus]|uniref:histidine kinase n=1 Tax=Lamprobacter modestohalophilus TaxID=1064514 RepID=A0A9X1B5D0_9GAMM|nr:HAMP domain-containing sensor histidine kinase [Lamprobacter modestohalophilus]MBK1619994.1 histidine kinase [Lamprobacter modestohalophilus]